MILGWLLTGFESFLLKVGGKVGILEGESESFLLRPVGKVGILSLNLKFKGDFPGNLN